MFYPSKLTAQADIASTTWCILAWLLKTVDNFEGNYWSQLITCWTLAGSNAPYVLMILILKIKQKEKHNIYNIKNYNVII